LISFFLVHLTTFMTAECVLYSIKLEDDVEWWIAKIVGRSWSQAMLK
jgi:hypothetical protein